MRNRAKGSLVAAALCALTSVGCTADVAIPAASRIACTETSDCPEGFVCKAALGRCATATGGDQTPPEVVPGTVEIAPAAASAGRTVTVSFEVSEALLVAPEVVLDGAERRALALEAEDGLRYRFAFVPSGREGEGAAALVATLVDRAGNEAKDQTLGTLILDFQPPTASDYAVLGAPQLGPGRTGRLAFTVSEPLSAPPEVRLEDGAALTLDDASAPPRYVYAYTATGAEAEGPSRVVVTGADPAENPLGPRTYDAFVFDPTPPEVVAGEVLTAAVREGRYAGVRFEVSEALAATPEVILEGPEGAQGALRLSEKIGNVYTYDHLVTGADAEGAYTVRVTRLEDLAGNAIAAPADLGTILVDRTAPALTGLEATPARASRVPGFDRVAVRFTVSEDVGEGPEGPEVTVGGGAPLTCTRTGLGPFTYACEHAVDPLDEAGLHEVAVTVRDAAGNTALARTAVLYDFDPPSVTGLVEYRPDAANPLALVSAAREGTTVRVAVTASERLDGTFPPTVEAVLGGTTLTAAARLAPGATYTEASFDLPIPGGIADGHYDTFAVVRDLAGNEARAPFGPGIDVKATPPVLVVDQAQVTYVRSPWGNGAPEDLGGYGLPAGPYYALDPADPLDGADRLPSGTFTSADGAPLALVRVWGAADASAPLGTLRPNADGTWPRRPLFSTPELPTVWVTGVDAAGNESSERTDGGPGYVRIENVEWVATPKQPTVGHNPNRLTGSVRGDAAWIPEADALAVGAEAAAADGVAARLASDGVWQARTFDGRSPDPRSECALVYDGVRGRAVLFGGYGGVELVGTIRIIRFQDTWEWDGLRWENRTPAGPLPSERSGPALAYDGLRGRVVLFGGKENAASGSGLLADTWEWDGEGWAALAPPGDAPPARTFAASAFDPVRGRVVLFGGHGASGSLADTWEWDGSRWTEVTPPSGGPGAREGAALAFDAARGRLVLFGGYTSGVPGAAAYHQDTWTWDGSAWTEVTPAEAPPPRAYARMVYDPVHTRTVLFGGRVPNGYGVPTYADDLWTWDGASWTGQTPPGAGPAPREKYGLAYDAVRGEVLLFGGFAQGMPVSGRFADTWAFDGTRWSERTPSAAAPPLGAFVGAWDPARERAVLFQQALGETWEWDGARWSNRTPSAGGPTPRSGAAMAWDGASQRMLLFGGEDAGVGLGDTWAWDGVAWTEVTPAGPSPSPRAAAAMAWDDALGAVVLYGGATPHPSTAPTPLGDLWTWDGAAWTPAPPTGTDPGPRYGMAMVYDAARAVVVLHGGRQGATFPGDTWTWDGTGWTEAAPAAAGPGARTAPSLAYDPIRQRTVLFGGYLLSAGADVADLWAWDGTGWREVPPSGARPSPRRDAPLVYDAARDALLLQGGLDGGAGYLPDTWTFTARAARRPALQLEVSPAAAGIDPATVTGLTVRADTGGLFSPYEASAVGATLLGWRPSAGGWAVLGQDGVGLGEGALDLPLPPGARIVFTATDAAARAYLLGRDGRLAVQVRPDGGSGTSGRAAEVGLDYLEVRVRYRVR